MPLNQNTNPPLDDVLEEMASAAAPPDARQLRAWVERYPQFRAEIVDFATAWIEMEAVPASEAAQDEVEIVVNRALSRVRELRSEGAKPAAIGNLAAEIQAAGGFDAFQRAAGIDRSMLTCLEKRLIRPATIPARMVAAVAQALGRDAAAVRGYLRLPPHSAAAYKASRQPELKQVDFAEIVRHADIPEAEKARWLAAPPDPAFRE